MSVASDAPPPALLQRTFGRFRGRPGQLWTGALLLWLLFPVCIDSLITDKNRFTYLYAAAAHLTSSGFCIAAGRSLVRQRRRWQILALVQALHTVIYLDAILRDEHLPSYLFFAWLGNFASAASVTLMLPALMSTRIGRGKALRILDSLLVVLFGMVLMFSLGSGDLVGDGPVRLNIGLLAMGLLSALALITRFSQADTGIHHFTNVVSKTIWVDMVATVLVNLVCYRWLTQVPDTVIAPLCALSPLLLCYWATHMDKPRILDWFPVDRAVIDSLQPSVLTVCSVVLILFTFQKRPVLVGALVITVVLLHAARTQFFYSRLFRERHSLRTQTEYLHKLATRDPLTGIANRRWFVDSVVRRLEKSFAYPCSLLMVDTDRFKGINDSCGHGAGDAVLCMIADVLQRETDGMDDTCVGRIGGDEFAVLLPSITEERAAWCAERIRNSVESQGKARCHGATVSIGVATLHSGGSHTELLQAADEALYRAKAQGRNAVQVKGRRARASLHLVTDSET